MMVANLGLAALAGPQTALIVVGLVQLAVLAALGLMPGEAGSNEFGPPPGRKYADLQQTFG